MRARAVAFLTAAAALAWPAAAPAVQLVDQGKFSAPIYVTAPPGDPHRLFVVEKEGTIVVVHDGVPKDFLTIPSDQIVATGEEGLLSMAFAPDYATSGRFYVYYTAPRSGDANGNVGTLAEYRRSAADPDQADPTSRRVVFSVDHPAQENHNGGQLQFGPDGLLYFGTGDGGGADDPNGNAQNPNSLLGKLFRLDPTKNAPPQMYALGLRNPWRFSFDRAMGAMLIGDVGQDAREEIDRLPPGAAAGTNFGWNCREGTIAGPGNCTGDFTEPIFDYQDSPTNCAALTGGYVVRNHDLDSLYGRYVYVDYCGGDVRSLIPTAPTATDDRSTDLPPLTSVFSFGEDSCGHLYAAQGTGEVYALVDDGASLTPCPEPPVKKPPPKKPPPDRTPPHLTVKRKFRQSLSERRSLFVGARCDERCALTATARLHVPGIVDPIEIGAVGRTVRAKHVVRLRLLLTRDQARTVRAALRDGHTVRGRIRVVARDAAGNQSGKRRKVLVLL